MAESKDPFEERKKVSSKLMSENPNYVLLEFRKSEKCKLDCFESKK